MISAWQPYVPSNDQPWNIARVKHLHRRAAFGATWSEMQRDLKVGPEQSVANLLNGGARQDGLRNDFDSISEIIAKAAVQSDDLNRLQGWWLFRMLFTPDPVREKLTLTWHNHFATSNLKVERLALMHRQNELFRKHALGPFSQLLNEVLHDPAMLIWLDANSNRKQHPNENLARELLELFTLGVGNYTENDVQEAARALTGWSTHNTNVRFNEAEHDVETKTVLGRTENFNVDSLADLLLDHEATSKRLAWRLCDVFMGESVVSEAELNDLATGLREHELDIKWAVETILRSKLFFQESNIASRVSSPVEYVVGTVRSLELFEKPPSTLILAEWCSRLGQELFMPPNVGGWNGGRSWLSSRTIVGRSNFAVALVEGELQSPIKPLDFSSLMNKYEWERDLTSAQQASQLQTLLLSRSCEEEVASNTEVSETIVQLLSCPQALLT